MIIYTQWGYLLFGLIQIWILSGIMGIWWVRHELKIFKPNESLDPAEAALVLLMGPFAVMLILCIILNQNTNPRQNKEKREAKEKLEKKENEEDNNNSHYGRYV